MKHFVLLISLVFSVNCFAQEPDSDLFQTWYLHSVLASDATPMPFIVSDITPEITPTLTIDENFEFSGTAACNSFNGTLDSNSPYSNWTTSFSSTDLDCGVAIHNSFEAEYFNYLQMLNDYNIEADEEGLVLTITTPPFGYGVFKNYPLNTSDFDSFEIDIFPNPASQKIQINTKHLITKIEVYSLNGKKIISQTSQFESINITDLDAGMYILKIYTEDRSLNKKLIKQ
ncbi:T9SS type A sorting domain-containing protein [Psychroflexus planctonicus]|uniref:Secretion system C-terminal sorting domain-containing protein n=1 Tax=Psychroflexus planctonicus TaxID=1526575 RepID=A0ABQ1SIV4_9FLAO|nr:T9SS type A sorting domain-containing protein [Psychroflexus planctonicus]GGE40900.1 hypothetical protein GCM10010832_21210 [Psychroflexus planctonicus]